MKKGIINKKTSGITLITLVITIVVLLILASIATYSGIDIVKSAQVTQFVTEMKILQTQVNKISTETEGFKDSDGEKIQTNSTRYNELVERISNVQQYGYSNEESEILNYRFFTAQKLKDELSIDGVEQSVFINLEKRKVISLEGVKYEGKTVYVLEQLPDSLYNVDYVPESTSNKPTFDVKVSEVEQREKWEIEVNNIQFNGNIEKWEVYYRKEDTSNWSVSKKMSFIVEEKGNYKIKIVNGDIQSAEKTVTLSGYNTGTTVAEAKAQNLPYKENTTIVDSYSNKIIVPAGFKIAQDSANEVANGIVIEDATYEGTIESQFVWIPVGSVSPSGMYIELGRYEFNNYSGSASTYYSSEYTEDTKINHNSSYHNQIAKDIEDFRAAAQSAGGYYIGRYEARVENYGSISTSNSSSSKNWTGYSPASGKQLQLVCKPNAQVWNYITQNKAAEVSKNMYKGTTFTSDLMNSYAWDTAIYFLQTFDNRTSGNRKTYSLQNSVNLSIANQGTNGLPTSYYQDEICNVWDMASNCWEWSTETFYSNFYYACVQRGGNYYNSNYYARDRYYSEIYKWDNLLTFRPILYISNKTP